MNRHTTHLDSFRSLHRWSTTVIAAAAALVLTVCALVSVASPANAAPETDTMFPGERLYPDQRLVASDGSSVLLMQQDGNLVLIQRGNRAIWASNTSGNPGAFLAMQEDGNAVIRAPGNRAVWASNTGVAGTVLRLQNDGNLVAIAPGNRPVWASGSKLQDPTPPPPPPTGGSCPSGGAKMDATFFEKTGHSNTDLRLRVRWVQVGKCYNRVYRAGSATGTKQEACKKHNWIPNDRFATYGFQAVAGRDLGQRSAFRLETKTNRECGSGNGRYAKGNFAIHASSGFRRSGNGWTGKHSTDLSSLGCIKLSTYNFANLYDVWTAAGSPTSYTIQVVRNQGLPEATVGLTTR